MTITLEIDNHQDVQFILELVKRLGIKIKKHNNDKAVQKELDATDYLFSTEANKKHLLQAIEYVENGGELIEVDLDELKNQFLK